MKTVPSSGATDLQFFPILYNINELLVWTLKI
jgi:hypothetical protein